VVIALGAGADPAAAITDGYVLALRVGAVVVLLAAALAAVLTGREAGMGEPVVATR